MNKGLQLAIKAAGSRYRLAKLIKITATSVQAWKEIPIRRVIQVEEVTGVPREILRPDLYRPAASRRKH